MNLLPKHRKELEASKIHPHVISLNFESIAGDDAYDALLYSDKIERTNTGRLASRYLKAYRHIDVGGWWCNGIDPMSENWDAPMTWGCFKPDHPRRDANDLTKLIKYEHPPKTPTRAFFLRVSWEVGMKIAIKAGKQKEYGDRIPSGTSMASEDRQFWGWVFEENISITITEGAKKAASLMSAGYVAIGLPGITGAVRTKESGERVSPFLIAEINIFANEERRINICFDFETKEKTIKNVQREIGKLGDLLTQAKCDCRIVELPGPDKGVDDFLVKVGEEAFDKLYELPPDFRFWEFNRAWKLTYTRDLVINSRYFGKIDHGQKGLCGIKGAMGSGKTKSLEEKVQDAIANGQKVLVITHRIELGRAICAAIGINWVDECKDSAEGRVFGFGFCVDSCHLLSQARIDPEDWEGAVVIVDEVEQVLWHLFNSATCYEKRAVILRTFEKLIQTVLGTEGLVIIQDADLSDYSVNYFIEISGIEGLKPRIIENIYKGKGRDVTYYTDKIEATYASLEQKVGDDKKVITFLDSQKIKGKFSAINLECQIKKNHPQKKILRIDSQTVGDPNHPAFACAKRINDLILDYDVVIATPTIGTGVSIDIRGHFDAVFGIFKGAIATNDVMQMMNRVRDEGVEWHLWVAPYGCGKIGNGSSNDYILWTSKDKVTRKNLELLNKADQSIETDLLDTHIDPRHTRAWAKFGARINAGQWNYRDVIYNLLIAANHRVKFSDDSQRKIDDQILSREGEAAYNRGDHDEADRIEAERARLEQAIEAQDYKNKEIKAEANAIRQENRVRHAQKVVAMPKPDRERYKKLQEKRSKTPDELLEEEKFRISETYLTEEVTEDLVIKDEDGWYAKIRLDYLLRNSEKVIERDRNHLKSAMENGEGTVTLQDLKFLSAKVEILNKLGMLEILNGEIYTNDSPEIQRIYKIVTSAPWDFKNFVGFLPSKLKSEIRTINEMLNSTLGIKLSGKMMTIGGERKRGYSFVGYDDGREKVWERWQIREQEWVESQINEKSGCTPQHNKEYIENNLRCTEETNTPEVIDQPTSVVELVEEVEEVGTVEVMVVEEVEAIAIAPAQLPTPPQSPQEGWIIAPPDQYWEEVMNYIYQGVNPIKQWIGKFMEVVSAPFQYWVDSPWFVQGWIRDGMGSKQKVVLPIALIG